MSLIQNRFNSINSTTFSYGFIGITTVILGYYTFFENDIEIPAPEQSPIIGQSTPSIIGQSIPSIIGQSTPSIIGQSTPSIIGQSTPSIFGQSTPSTPSIFGQEQIPEKSQPMQGGRRKKNTRKRK